MVPVTQLTPFLPDMKLSKFSEKEKIVLLSDDPITNDPSGLSRDYVVQMLKARMPEFEFITIKNMALDDYLDLASRAMFSITFGEGMDGYYIEPILAGAISFAVYNSTFFPTEFKNHPGIFQDWNSVVSRLPEIVNNLLDAVSYDTTSQFLRENLGEIYSETRSTTELLKLIGGEADFAPLPRYGAANKNPIRQKLLSLGINFYEFGDQHVCALPDGSVLRNFGEDVYDLSREIFINKDFEFELDPKKKYVLIDLGANIGLTTIYLLRKFSNIIKSYAFEPVELTARIARENFRGNQLHERVDLYQIGLSNSFSRKHLEFTPSQSTLFSTDSNALPETPDWDYKFSNNGGHVDVEVARANAELDFILKRHSNERLILKCDTRGSELAVVSSLAANRELTRFDNIVVQSYRDDVDSMIGLLKTNGFSVEVKEACSKNVYHTIRATKDANMQN
jgi:FkbM family methyltransferase